MNAISSMLKQVRAQEPGAVEKLVRLPKVREVLRVRAAKASGFPWTVTSELRLDAARCAWEVGSTIKDDTLAKLKHESSTLAYLAGGIRNRLHKQIRADLGLREVVITDDFGHRRYQLIPKIVRESFVTALARVDDHKDPVRVLGERESVLELERALRTARMDNRARQVLGWRMAGHTGAEMRRRLGRAAPALYGLLRQARGAVRDRLHQIRAGMVG